ncbi:hypothetical protein R1sor_001345 [Riccia sorocarpa]|uniref:Uncharacterized protein n=1 Tax=Riccia sorocarpa TaxID=122646 RepID=A0ABD3GW09_9MARC
MDSRKQYISLRFGSSSDPSFLIFAYFRPCGAPVYARFDKPDNPFVELLELVVKLGDSGPVWILGRFLWADIYVDELVTVGGLTIMNGTPPFSSTRACNCQTSTGASLVDYLLASKNDRERVVDFSVGHGLQSRIIDPLCVHYLLHMIGKDVGRRNEGFNSIKLSGGNLHGRWTNISITGRGGGGGGGAGGLFLDFAKCGVESLWIEEGGPEEVVGLWGSSHRRLSENIKL